MQLCSWPHPEAYLRNLMVLVAHVILQGNPLGYGLLSVLRRQRLLKVLPGGLLKVLTGGSHPNGITASGTPGPDRPSRASSAASSLIVASYNL